MDTKKINGWDDHRSGWKDPKDIEILDEQHIKS